MHDHFLNTGEIMYWKINTKKLVLHIIVLNIIVSKVLLWVIQNCHSLYHNNQLTSQFSLLSYRIVVYGKDMLSAVVPNSAKPFNFQKEYGLTYQQVGSSHCHKHPLINLPSYTPWSIVMHYKLIVWSYSSFWPPPPTHWR